METLRPLSNPGSRTLLPINASNEEKSTMTSDIETQRQGGDVCTDIPDQCGGRADSPVPADDPGALSSAALAPLRVLIVDDAASTRRFLRTVLDHCEQFEVVAEAEDGAVAVEMTAALQPDLVLLDLSMPFVNGASALVGMLEAAPDTMVIIVSGANPAAGGPLLDAGAAAFVPKGIPPYELLRRLGAIVGRPVDVDSCGGGYGTGLDGTTASSEVGSGLRPRYRAVVFEDDPVVRTLVSKVFKDHDVAVVAETNIASTLLTVVDLAQPEFVLLDFSHEVQSDAVILADILDRSPRSVVVVYSEFQEWRERALAAGAAAFVEKPHIDELIDEIDQLTPSR